jgi:hypothetical protein
VFLYIFTLYNSKCINIWKYAKYSDLMLMKLKWTSF